MSPNLHNVCFCPCNLKKEKKIERKKYKGGLISILNIRAIGVFVKIIYTREKYILAVSIPFDSADMTISNKN